MTFRNSARATKTVLGQLAIGLTALLTTTAIAQDRPGAPYCAELKRVAQLALSASRFASITGAPREGSFRATTLSLTGWKDCTLYGEAMYTCDSQGFAGAEEAAKAQAQITDQILSC